MFLLPIAETKILPKKEGMIQITIPADIKEDVPYASLFSEQVIQKRIDKMKQIKIILDNDEVTNHQKLQLIRYEAMKIKYINDTSTAIIVILTNSSVYSTIIRLINLCIIDKHKEYVLLNNRFIIFGEPLTQPKKLKTNYLCLLCGDLIIVPSKFNKKSIIEKVNVAINPFSILQIASLALGWLLLIASTSFYHRKK